MLKVDHLSTSYKTLDGDVHVINDLNFEIRENEIFGIAGESGCGKTTLLKTLYDIVEYPLVIDQGKVTLSGEKNGKPFSFESGQIRKTWWNNISYVPQAAQSVLNPIVRLKKQFLDSIPKQDKRNETEKQTLARVAKYLEELSLSPDVLEAYPFQLSGGMRQRVIIALATFMSPSVVLADEPTTALDVVVQRGILMMLMRLQRRLKNTMVIVSHDMGVHYQVTDRMAIMYSGSIIELGNTEEIFSDPVHPYTTMLVGSLPRVGDKSQKVGIPGRPPALTNPPPGCRFAPRCPYATDLCRKEIPAFREVKPGRFAACHLLNKGMIRGKKLVAVDDVSISIDNDKPVILSVVGESGCGKSTLCKMVLRLHRPDMGDIILDGRSYLDKKGYDPLQFKLDVQPIFQNPYESFSARKPVDSYQFNTALRLGIAKNREEATKLVDEALKSVGLSLAVVKGKYPTQFSGGELQRVSIARALITRPKLIIADEPVAAIDASMKMNIVNLFKELKDKYGISFIYITHDLSTAYYVSDYIATLYRGCLIEYGPAKEIMDNPAHPYTELLMNAVPKVGDKWKEDLVLPDMEDKEYSISYCKFAPRCPYATDECRNARPGETYLNETRKVMCFHPLKG